MTRSTLAVVTLCATCPVAIAQEMEPISQTRLVATGGFLEPCFKGFDEVIDAQDFGDFDEMILREEHCPDTKAIAVAATSQQSIIRPRSVTVFAEVTTTLEHVSIATNLVIAYSDLEYTFKLTKDSDFVISGDVVGSDHAFWRSYTQLYSFDTGEVIKFNFSANGDEPGFEDSFGDRGHIPAGRYKLHVASESAIDAPDVLGDFDGLTSFGVRFALGGDCRADLTGDGDLGADDFFLFLDLFAGGDDRADFDDNGGLDADDFFQFLDLFSLGCD